MKTLSLLFLLCSIIFLSGCGDKKTETLGNGTIPNAKANERSGQDIIQFAKSIYGEDVKNAISANFGNEEKTVTAIGLDVNTKESFGIRFIFAETADDSLKELYATPVLDGMMNMSSMVSVEVSGIPYNLLYYSSNQGYLGSNLGEVFSYLVDYPARKVYRAHLFYSSGIPVSLYVEGAAKTKAVHEYFVKEMKERFPELQLTDKDRLFDN